ncbi:unnamed protein product [Lupinus luteus]|uniref:3-hydroxyisobutyryl-CoA hydrolase n=1 Tax=Lupinus luteus TaxID=3873 RepID=A0AAV1XS05_LUPLU
MKLGHWTYPILFYKKQLILDHLIATCKKPMVSIINGIVMGGRAGLSMNTTFRIVTERAVFSMPEASMGLFPHVGANYFLSRLPGYFGEYLGLTGARLHGAEIAACGLAAHYVPSMKLESLENALEAITSSNVSAIATLIETFSEKGNVDENKPFSRLEAINKCFSKGTVEEIIQSLGSRAKLFDKDNEPKWEPSKLELVTEEMVDLFFQNVDDEEWEPLQFPDRSHSQIASRL